MVPQTREVESLAVGHEDGMVLEALGIPAFAVDFHDNQRQLEVGKQTDVPKSRLTQICSAI